MTIHDRELRFEQKMSEAEAMMWNVEKDPWLSASFGTITTLDRPADPEVLRLRMLHAVAAIPRMRQRVRPSLGRLSPPTWEPDPEFKIDHHLRHVSLPAPGSERQLLDLATTLLEDPFDRTRPLWQFVCIEGLQDGRGALFTKLHHTITDGEGGVRLAERYMDVERDAPLPDPIEITDAAPGSQDGAGSVASTARGALTATSHLLRRQAGIARRAVGEAALAAVDPARLVEAARNAASMTRAAQSQLTVSGTCGSPLWRVRSRHRHLEVLRVAFADAKDAAQQLGGSLNDLFVTAATQGAVRYHDKHAAPAEHFHITFVVSTRDDRSAGGNAFTPAKVTVPAGPMNPADRFRAVRAAVSERRGDAGGAIMAAASGIANLLPTSTMTAIARAQAASVDFATSNVRAAPFDLYIAGAKVLAPYPIGPVAGTAWNITMLSYAGSLCIGIHSDAQAVTDPALLADCIRTSFDELVEAAREQPRPERTP